MTGRWCGVDGCPRPVLEGQRLCERHRGNERREGADCLEVGCVRSAYLDGLCKRHADQAWYRDVVRGRGQ